MGATDYILSTLFAPTEGNSRDDIRTSRIVPGATETVRQQLELASTSISSKDGYEIRSYGRDGERDDHPPVGLTGDLDADIVFPDVRFTQAPFED